MNRLAEFEENIRTNRVMLVRIINSNIRTSADAEDIFQRASLTMWRKYDNFDSKTAFIAWASTIVKFEACNFRRSYNRCPVSFDSEVYDVVSLLQKTESTIDDERYEKLQLALNCLDKDTKKLLVSVYLNGEEIKTIAEKTGKSPRTLYNKINLAKKKLVEMINK